MQDIPRRGTPSFPWGGPSHSLPDPTNKKNEKKRVSGPFGLLFVLFLCDVCHRGGWILALFERRWENRSGSNAKHDALHATRSTHRSLSRVRREEGIEQVDLPREVPSFGREGPRIRRSGTRSFPGAEAGHARVSNADRDTDQRHSCDTREEELRPQVLHGIRKDSRIFGSSGSIFALGSRTKSECKSRRTARLDRHAVA